MRFPRPKVLTHLDGSAAPQKPQKLDKSKLPLDLSQIPTGKEAASVVAAGQGPLADVVEGIPFSKAAGRYAKPGTGNSTLGLQVSQMRGQNGIPPSLQPAVRKLAVSLAKQVA